MFKIYSLKLENSHLFAMIASNVRVVTSCATSPTIVEHCMESFTRELADPGTLSHCSGGSKGGRQGRAPPPWGPKFFHFHAVFDQKNKFAYPLWELAPTPWGNPGSATALVEFLSFSCICQEQFGQIIGWHFIGSVQF